MTVLLALGTLIFALPVWASRAAEADQEYVIRTHPLRPTAKSLVLFLSQPEVDGPLVHEIIEETESGPALTDPDLRERFRGPWRQALEALCAHAAGGCISDVVFIGSRESVRFSSDFARLVVRVWPHGCLRVREAAELEPQLEGGIDFSNLEELSLAVRLVRRSLRRAGFHMEDILIDITGGTKLASIAGAIHSVPPGRVFQYVNRAHEVHEYDVQRISEDGP